MEYSTVHPRTLRRFRFEILPRTQLQIGLAAAEFKSPLSLTHAHASAGRVEKERGLRSLDLNLRRPPTLHSSLLDRSSLSREFSCPRGMKYASIPRGAKTGTTLLPPSLSSLFILFHSRLPLQFMAFRKQERL